jgi:hypothetical protein
MKRNRLKSVVALFAAMLAVNASADNAWTGATLDGLWSTPGNWSLGVVPAPGLGQGNTIINNQAGGSTVTVGAGTLASLDGDLFAPEWGMTLNVDGGRLTQLSPGFVFAPVGAAANPSTINVMNGGYLEVQELLIGDNWWFNTAPGVVLNVSDTSTVKARGWTWIGGEINLTGGLLDIGGDVNMNAGGQNNAHVDIAGGTWIVRGADISAKVATWIGTGELTAYGGLGSIVVDTLSIPGGTVITAVPEPSSFALLGLGSLLLFRRKRA